MSRDTRTQQLEASEAPSRSDLAAGVPRRVHSIRDRLSPLAHLARIQRRGVHTSTSILCQCVTTYPVLDMLRDETDTPVRTVLTAALQRCYASPPVKDRPDFGERAIPDFHSNTEFRSPHGLSSFSFVSPSSVRLLTLPLSVAAQPHPRQPTRHPMALPAEAGEEGVGSAREAGSDWPRLRSLSF